MLIFINFLNYYFMMMPYNTDFVYKSPEQRKQEKERQKHLLTCAKNRKKRKNKK